ncbi:MAG TPA: coenzyme F420-0:L-glutamate ligase, partial [Chloroflexota bacterium]|nr:coenzyme F420-0:L-glutamate ligase [Chloroflexota bacterium]
EAHYTGRSSTIPCHPQSATHYSPLTTHYSFLAYTPLVVEIRLIGVRGVGEVRPGDEPAALLVEAFERQGERFQSGDVLVVTQKIVSKAEGRLVDLATVEPSDTARQLSEISKRDPRQIEVALRESARIVRMERGVLISETSHGFICANAGVDGSNLGSRGVVSLLPLDPDASAERIRRGIGERTEAEVAVIISDTFGRPWRTGQTNVAIGVAGLRPLRDYRGQRDSAGQTLVVTEIAVVDELASGAELAMGKLDRVPAAVVRGYEYESGEGRATELVRPRELDFFR